jgi:hypothetical protein
MNKLLDIIVFIFQTYPNIKELSKPRLVKLIYLTDWKNCVDNGNQLTNINWFFNHYGPYVDDIIELIKEKTDFFEVNSSINPYGGVSEKITLKNSYTPNLSTNEKSIITFIIEKTSHLSWTNFISLVYSTFPIRNNSKYSFLNLKDDATKFKHYSQH